MKNEFIVYKAKTILFRGKPMQISVGSPIFRTFSDKKISEYLESINFDVILRS